MLVLGATAVVGSGLGGTPTPVGPGSKLGTMTLVKGTVYQADRKLFDLFREWNVILIRPKPGRHTLRYRSRRVSAGTTDSTWTFVVAGG